MFPVTALPVTRPASRGGPSRQKLHSGSPRKPEPSHDGRVCGFSPCLRAGVGGSLAGQGWFRVPSEAASPEASPRTGARVQGGRHALARWHPPHTAPGPRDWAGSHSRTLAARTARHRGRALPPAPACSGRPVPCGDRASRGRGSSRGLTHAKAAASHALPPSTRAFSWPLALLSPCLPFRLV